MLSYREGRVVIHRIGKEMPKNLTREYIMGSKKYDEKLINLPLNDTGNARRVLLFGENYFKFNLETGTWLLWSGKVWRSVAAEQDIKLLIQTVMDKYYKVVSENKELDETVKKTMLSHARRANDNNGINNILCLLRAMNYVKGMRCKSHYLNVQNGVVNLKTKELMPHWPEYGCTNICRFAYNPNVKSSRFKSFVKEISDYDMDIYDYLKLSSGYGITGSVKEQKLFIYLGTGANGKSRYLETVAYALGDYANVFPISAILKSNMEAGRPTPDLIPLINKRFTYASEIKGENSMNDAAIKQLSGNSKIPIRKMRQEYRNVDVTFKIIVDTNNAPSFKHFDYAIKRRIVIVPFNRKFAGEQKDENLKTALFADGEFVLKWLIDAAYQYYKEGLHEPPVIIEATEAYCEATDSVGSFIKHVIEMHDGEWVRSSELYEAYKQYCLGCGFEILEMRSFSQTMQNRGFKKKLKNSGAYFKDIIIKR